MARTHHSSHDAVCQLLLEALHEAGHAPECVLRVGLRLCEWYACSVVEDTQGDAASLAQLADLLHRETGAIVLQMYKYRNQKFPIEE